MSTVTVSVVFPGKEGYVLIQPGAKSGDITAAYEYAEKVFHLEELDPAETYDEAEHLPDGSTKVRLWRMDGPSQEHN